MSKLIPRCGDTLNGRWKLDKKIAEGGVGCIFEASDLAHKGEKVALKVMHPGAAANEFVRKRFQSEGKIAASLGQLGNVEVDETEKGIPFFTMSLLKGSDLASMRAESPEERLPVEEVVPAIAQALDVLASAHRKGIIHCDIKPDNIFVTNEGQVKVIDFGIAQLKGGGRFPDGKFYGTQGYAPPEQILGKRVDSRSDVYAVGAAAFELLTGVTAETDVPPIQDAAPHVPTDIARIIDKALSPDPGQRYADAGAMLAALLPRLVKVAPAKATTNAPAKIAPFAPPKPAPTPPKLPQIVPVKPHVLALMRDHAR